MRFYIFRHGQTFSTKFGRPYGLAVFSAGILDEGKPALNKMGQYLKKVPSDFNVSSPFRRCKQTVEIISTESGKTFYFDKRLGEYLLETRGNFRKRIKSLILEVESLGYEHVLICTHGAVISEMMDLLLPGVYNVSNTFKFPDPGILIIAGDGKYEEISFNN